MFLVWFGCTPCFDLLCAEAVSCENQAAQPEKAAEKGRDNCLHVSAHFAKIETTSNH
jgi:hypothetical protein